MYHYARPSVLDGPAWLRNVLGSGHVGVGVFFVLSGFVLAYRYLDPHGRRSVPLRAFWVARIARVYPMYLVGILLMLPQHRATGTAQPPLLEIGMLQTWVPNEQFGWNGDDWSVSAEAFFYAVFPFVAVRMARLGDRALVVAMALTWALAIAAPVGYVLLAPPAMGLQSSQDLWLHDMVVADQMARLVALTPLLRLPEFLLGVLVATRFVRNPPSAGAWWSVAGGLGMLAGMALGDRIPYLVLNNGLLAGFAAMLVYGLARGGGPLAWLLSRRPLVQLGEASYSLYLLQGPLMVLLIAYAGLPTDPQLLPTAPVWLTVYCTVLLAVALCLFQFMERPWRKRLLRVLGRGAQAEVGRVNQKVEPLPGPSERAPMRPPWASMISLAIARPNPVPWIRRRSSPATR